MKNSIKSLIATSLTAILLTVTFIAAKAGTVTKNVTILNQVKNISKIVVSGNVELILVQDNNEGVQVYNNYYSNNALVQEQNGLLRISSFEKEKLTVVAYVKNVTSIEASENATVKTQGNFYLLGLDVSLKDNATASINANTVSLFTDVNDNSRLELKGTTSDYNALMGTSANLDISQFAAESTSIKTNKAEIKPAVKVADLPSIEEIGYQTIAFNYL